MFSFQDRRPPPPLLTWAFLTVCRNASTARGAGLPLVIPGEAHVSISLVIKTKHPAAPLGAPPVFQLTGQSCSALVFWPPGGLMESASLQMAHAPGSQTPCLTRQDRLPNAPAGQKALHLRLGCTAFRGWAWTLGDGQTRVLTCAGPTRTKGTVTKGGLVSLCLGARGDHEQEFTGLRKEERSYQQVQQVLSFGCRDKTDV